MFFTKICYYASCDTRLSNSHVLLRDLNEFAHVMFHVSGTDMDEICYVRHPLTHALQ